jgi:phage protein D
LTLDAGLAPTVDGLEVIVAADPAVAVGDAATASLGYEDARLVEVFTGTVDHVRRRLDGTKALGAVSSAGGALARLRVNQSYERQSAGKVVRDLADRAGIDVGTVEDGVDLAFFVVDDRRNAYVHIAELARRSGYLAFTDPAGRLSFAPPAAGRPIATFRYAVDVMALEVEDARPELGEITTWGEGAAGSEGREAWAWLVKELGPVTARAGSGSPVRGIPDPALRSAAAAAAAASAMARAVAARRRAGRLVVVGTPEVAVGSTIEIADAPAGLDGRYLARRVRHRLDRRTGFTSELALVGAVDGPPGAPGLGGLP